MCRSDGSGRRVRETGDDAGGNAVIGAAIGRLCRFENHSRDEVTYAMGSPI